MARIRVLPYKQGSRSAKALAEELGGKVLKLQNSSYKPREGDTVINWGNSGGLLQGRPTPTHGNDPYWVGQCSNKLRFFQSMQEYDWLPQFWTNKEDIKDEDYPIVCRTVLSGHSGAGIVIADDPDGLVDAPLYVKYIKKKDEYRVHCGKDGKTISIQRKARRLSVPDGEVNWRVRNLDGGFVFVREGVTPPSAVEEVAHFCLRETGLDFGAVDVIWNEQQQRAYVLEINSAPGLEGTTVKDYGDYFRSLING